MIGRGSIWTRWRRWKLRRRTPHTRSSSRYKAGIEVGSPSAPGEQVIRLLFDEPTRLRSIEVRFDEHGAARTQEFVLRWSPDRGRTYSEIVRQQYTFSPPGTTREVEHFAVDIQAATTLELRVIPDIGGGSARASLTRLRLA